MAADNQLYKISVLVAIENLASRALLGLMKEFASTQKASEEMTVAMKSANKAMLSAGVAATIAVGSFKLLKDSLLVAAGFQTQMFKVQQVMGLTNDQTTQWGEKIQDLSLRLGVLSQEQLGGLVMMMKDVNFSSQQITDNFEGIGASVAALSVTIKNFNPMPFVRAIQLFGGDMGKNTRTFYNIGRQLAPEVAPGYFEALSNYAPLAAQLGGPNAAVQAAELIGVLAQSGVASGFGGRAGFGAGFTALLGGAKSAKQQAELTAMGISPSTSIMEAMQKVTRFALGTAITGTRKLDAERLIRADMALARTDNAKKPYRKMLSDVEHGNIKVTRQAILVEAMRDLGFTGMTMQLAAVLMRGDVPQRMQEFGKKYIPPGMVLSAADNNLQIQMTKFANTWHIFMTVLGEGALPAATKTLAIITNFLRSLTHLLVHLPKGSKETIAGSVATIGVVSGIGAIGYAKQFLVGIPRNLAKMEALQAAAAAEHPADYLNTRGGLPSFGEAQNIYRANIAAQEAKIASSGANLSLFLNPITIGIIVTLILAIAATKIWEYFSERKQQQLMESSKASLPGLHHVHALWAKAKTRKQMENAFVQGTWQNFLDTGSFGPSVMGSAKTTHDWFLQHHVDPNNPKALVATLRGIYDKQHPVIKNEITLKFDDTNVMDPIVKKLISVLQISVNGVNQKPVSLFKSPTQIVNQ